MRRVLAGATRYLMVLLAFLALGASAAWAQPQWQSSQTDTGSSSTATVDKPSGLAVGDLMVVGLMFDNNRTVDTPSGWNLIRDTNSGTGSQDIHLLTYWKTADTDDVAASSFSWSISSSTDWAIGISRITGADPVSPIEVDNGTDTGNGSTTVTAPSVTTTSNGTLMMAFFARRGNSSMTYTPSAGLEERYDIARTDVAGMMATYTHLIAGSTGSVTATSSSDTGDRAAQQVAIKPAATYQVYTSGSSTFTVPSGVYQITVQTWGGGGRGGTRTSNSGGAGGGGGGAFSQSTLSVTPSQQLNYGVGAGSTSAGSTGGSSWFGGTNVNNAVVRAVGGNSVSSNSQTGANGGSASSGAGDITRNGGNGGSGGGSNSGGGGASAGFSANGGNASGATAGTAPEGGGNGAPGASAGSNGSVGSTPGGGGSGGHANSGTDRDGGSGADGRIVIFYEQATAPSNLSYSTPNLFTLNQAISALTPTVDGTVTSYSINPSLPTGLSFNTTTGVISGTPGVVTPQITYTVTASGPLGNTFTTLVIEVTGQQVYNSGSGTFTVPDGVYQITVQTWGGGGRGGSRNTGSAAYGGGGGGAFSQTTLSVTPGTQYNYSVGSGSNNNSNPGGDSWFSPSNQANAVVLAKGGSTVPNNGTTGADGGAAADGVGDIKQSGGSGANGNGSTNGGGGGSSASFADDGSNGSGSNGGTAPSGGGNGGNGATASNSNGFAGNSPGGGGGGARRNSSGSPTGGNGAAGRIVILMSGAAAPTNLNYGSPLSFVLNHPITPVTPTYGGVAHLFEVTGALDPLPFGLILDDETGELTGTPTSAGTYTVRIRATNTALDPDEYTETDVVIHVGYNSVSYPSPNLLAANYSYANITPTVVGSVSSYSISPALPAGMFFNSVTGAITGTPTVASPLQTYTVTAQPGNTQAQFDMRVFNTVFDAEFNPINFSNGSRTVISGSLTNSPVGTRVLYTNVITIGGQQIDAIVRIVSIQSGTSIPNFDHNAGTPSGNEDRWFSPELAFPSGLDSGSSLFQFDFLLGGTYDGGLDTWVPVTLENVRVNAYDIDGTGQANSNQNVEFGGFYTYELGNPTNVVATYNSSTGLTKFRSNTNTNNNDLTASNTRVRVTYPELSSFSISFGGGVAAYLLLDFSTGPTFAGAVSTTAPDIDLNGGGTGIHYTTTFCEVAVPVAAGVNVTSGSNAIDEMKVSFAAANILDGASEKLLVAGSSAYEIPLNFTTFGPTNMTVGGVTYQVSGSTSSGTRTLSFVRNGGGTVTDVQLEALIAAITYVNATPTVGNRIFNFTARSGVAVGPPATFTVTVEGCADLQITKTANVDSAMPGQQVVFMLEVTNDGAGNATGVVVSDPIPHGYTFDEAETATGTFEYEEGVLVWTIGNLANGATAELQLTVTVNFPEEVENEFVNVATVTGEQPDTETDNNTAEASVEVSTDADLVTVKTLSSGDSTPNVGDTVTFLITVTNNGPGTATGISLTDVLPTVSPSLT